MLIELLGVTGTICIVIAFMQNGEVKIRRLDLIGAVLFVVYGFLLPSFSTILLNAILCGVQIYKLIRLHKHS